MAAEKARKQWRIEQMDAKNLNAITLQPCPDASVRPANSAFAPNLAASNHLPGMPNRQSQNENKRK
jgi:hypothetical protein